MRLANGTDPFEGRVEVYHASEWGSICDQEWDIVDAAVVCAQLGFGVPLLAPTGAYFGEGSGPVWLSGLNCTGDEKQLDHCPREDDWGIHSCQGHSGDAGVVCDPGKIRNKVA